MVRCHAVLLESLNQRAYPTVIEVRDVRFDEWGHAGCGAGHRRASPRASQTRNCMPGEVYLMYPRIRCAWIRCWYRQGSRWLGESVGASACPDRPSGGSAIVCDVTQGNLNGPFAISADEPRLVAANLHLLLSRIGRGQWPLGLN